MKDIIGYEGLYAVTEDGQVWSYRSKKFLKLQLKKNGYLQVHLYKKGNQKQCLVIVGGRNVSWISTSTYQ